MININLQSVLMMFAVGCRRVPNTISMSSVDMYNTRVSSAEEKRKRRRQTKGEWEVMPGLKEGEKYDMKPLKFDGYLHKKRNPPLKGWHRVSNKIHILIKW